MNSLILDIISLYVTLLPLILAGVANMVFCKSPVCMALAYPMDGGVKLSDQRALFGPNKTWKGFLGMICFGAIFQVAWGFVLAASPMLLNLNLFYASYPNTASTNLWLGALIGLSYVLFELPNSFIKRRLGILPGKTATNHWKWLFFFVDQVDSLIGCAIFLAILLDLSWGQFFGIIVLGAGTHVLVNQVLYALKLRKNPF